MAIGLAALGLALPMLAGCGFRPLYGPTATSGQRLNDVLASVDISPIPGRVGQRIRNDLNFYSASGEEVATGSYRLEIAIRESVSSVMVKVDGSSTGQVYYLDATFKLVRRTDQKVVLQGNSYARIPYQIDQIADPKAVDGTSTGRSIFANVRARHDAENRAAEVLANDIKVRLAAFLSQAG